MNKRAIERGLRFFLRYWAATFAVVGALFVLAPNGTVRVINALGSWLGDFPPAPESDLKFWLSLGFSYMVLVTVLSWLASNDLYGRKLLLLILSTGKAASSLSCLVFYLASEPCFIYLLNFIVDGSIVLMMLPAYRLIVRLENTGDDAGPPSPPAPGSTEARVMRVMLRHLYPPTERVPFGAADVELDALMWRYAADKGAVMMAATRALMRFFEVAPILFLFRFRRFTELADRDAARFLEDSATSSLYPRRMAIFNVKFLADMHFYSHPRVREAVGFVDPPLPAETGPLAKTPSVWAWRMAKARGGAR